MSITRDPAVILKDVRKSFGDIHAVRALSAEIEEGCVYSLLGPNGSGKSTTMRMIMGLVRPDSGEIRVLGHDLKTNPLSVKRIIGHVPETPRLYEYLTGLEYLDFVGDVYGIGVEEKKDRIHEFIARAEGREDETMNGYSHGMKQKVAIIAAVLHRPRLLVLDESLSGLDPKSARITKDMIHRMAEEGATTIFSTHVLEIADVVCDRICVLARAGDHHICRNSCVRVPRPLQDGRSPRRWDTRGEDDVTRPCSEIAC